MCFLEQGTVCLPLYMQLQGHLCYLSALPQEGLSKHSGRFRVQAFQIYLWPQRLEAPRFSKFFQFPMLMTLLQIYWPLFTFCIANMASFLTQNSICTSILTGTYPKNFVGLIQMQCSPSFDCNWGKKTISLHIGTSYTHDIGFYSKRMSQLPTTLRGHSPNLHGW